MSWFIYSLKKKKQLGEDNASYFDPSVVLISLDHHDWDLVLNSPIIICSAGLRLFCHVQAFQGQIKMNQIHFVFFFNKFLFLFSSNLQTLHSKLKKNNFFLQENDQKNKQTNKKVIIKITCI